MRCVCLSCLQSGCPPSIVERLWWLWRVSLWGSLLFCLPVFPHIFAHSLTQIHPSLAPSGAFWVLGTIFSAGLAGVDCPSHPRMAMAPVPVRGPTSHCFGMMMTRGGSDRGGEVSVLMHRRLVPTGAVLAVAPRVLSFLGGQRSPGRGQPAFDGVLSFCFKLSTVKSSFPFCHQPSPASVVVLPSIRPVPRTTKCPL